MRRTVFIVGFILFIMVVSIAVYQVYETPSTLTLPEDNSVLFATRSKLKSPSSSQSSSTSSWSESSSSSQSSSVQPPCALSNVVFLITYKDDNRSRLLYDAMMYAWGNDILAAGASMELCEYGAASETLEPVLRYHNKYDKVLEVMWYGFESNREHNQTHKLFHSFSTFTQRHPHKSWFIKTDTDSFINARVLRDTLKSYPNPETKHWYIGWQRPGDPMVVGAAEIFSYAAMRDAAVNFAHPERVAAQYNFTMADFFRWEDVAVGYTMRSIGVPITEINHLCAPFGSGADSRLLVNHWHKDPNDMMSLKAPSNGYLPCYP
ncbi:hypothetical protein Pelo_5337 [Pelomyxa schiedti]|nr:hypothetical protein Pelo_5337 [Pelomyxa schiedti]